MARTAYTYAAAALLALAVTGPARSQAPAPAAPPTAAPARPAIATTKVPGTDNVYVFRNGNHQAMFIVTSDGVIARYCGLWGRGT